MRPAVADSDDDGEESLWGEDSPSKAAGNTVHGTIETNTGSTERLRQEIVGVEQRLFANSASVEKVKPNTISSQATPSLQAKSKRRHSLAIGPDGSQDHLDSVKRTKTTQTPREQRSSRTALTHLSQLSADHNASPQSSQYAQFTEHSGIHSSNGLSTGSIQIDFVNHEPNVMFRNSGSTLVDGTAVQQQLLLENTIPRGAATAQNDAAVSDRTQSPSLSWSGSGSNAKTPTVSGPPAVSHNPSTPMVATNHEEITETTLIQQSEENQTSDMSYVTANAGQPSLSPMVVISQHSARTSRSTRRSSAESQKTTKGRKRKAEAEFSSGADALNSDERDIGLPKENYQPRPSRRRATEDLEEPIDYSICPEKAAKLKRTRTSDGNSSSKAPPGAENSESIVNKSNDSHHHIETNDPPQSLKEVAPAPDPPSQAASLHDSTHGSQSKEDGIDAQGFVKPPKPAPKTKAMNRARRSQTTIFEDHRGFAGTDRTPNLSQQQADRKLSAAQKDLTTSQRKRQIIISDDEDEEQEDPSASKVPEGQTQQSSPIKKRGRGRPPKAAAKAAVKPVQKSAETIEEDTDEQDDDDPAEQDTAPKSKPKGRPAKKSLDAATTQDPMGSEKQREKQVGSDEDTSKDAHSQDPVVDPPTTSPNANAKNMPTPSPENKENAAQGQEKPGAASHSPIKNSSKVPLRVGLSRRQRIPSLLRVMRPPKA